MRTHHVYDLPLRLFHGLFATLFITAFLIAKTVDEDSLVFSIHMLAGLLLVAIVVLRVVWGFLGTKHSKFRNFSLHPKDLIRYFTGIVSGAKTKWAGHNPATSWAALIMFGLALGLGVSGWLMAQGNEADFEEIHELLANAFIVVVILHVTGVVMHSLRHQDGIALSMVDGAKQDVALSEAINHNQGGVAILFLGFVAAFTFYLGTHFDSNTRELRFFGTTLQLGESEEGADEGKEVHGELEGDEDL